jgi:hypothetical protein
MNYFADTLGQNDRLHPCVMSFAPFAAAVYGSP